MGQRQTAAQRRAFLEMGLGAGALAVTAACGGRNGGRADPDSAPSAPSAPLDTPGPAGAFAGGTTQAQANDRLGTLAPAWDVPFVAGQGPTLDSLKGQVTLLRFWTDTCPFCRATAPALVAIDEAYRNRGVTVVGMFHPKPKGSPRTVEQVATVAANYGFSFPVGLDLDWAVLDDYWMSLPDRRYTSVSFVIDQTSTIRFVHGGPEFHPQGPASHAQCRDDHVAVLAALDTLLA